VDITLYEVARESISPYAWEIHKDLTSISRQLKHWLLLSAFALFILVTTRN